MLHRICRSKWKLSKIRNLTDIVSPKYVENERNKGCSLNSGIQERIRWLITKFWQHTFFFLFFSVTSKNQIRKKDAETKSVEWHRRKAYHLVVHWSGLIVYRPIQSERVYRCRKLSARCQAVQAKMAEMTPARWSPRAIPMLVPFFWLTDWFIEDPNE